MATDGEVSVKIGAQTGELGPGMEGAAASVKESTEKMKASVAGMAAESKRSMDSMVAGIHESVTKARESFESFDAGLKSMIGGFAAIAAGGLIGDKIKEMVMGTAELGDEMGKTSQKIGMPVEQLSALKYSADLAGVSSESLDNGMKRLAMSMNMAQQGSKQQKDAFSELGVAVTDASGNLRPMGDVIGEVSDKFASMPDGTDKAAIAMTLFGRAGTDMIPMLDKGKAALAAEAEEAKNLGVTWTDLSTKQATELIDSTKRMDAAFTGIKNQLVAAFIPALTEMTNSFVASLAPGGSMRDVMIGVGETIDTVVVVFKNLWAVVSDVAKTFWDAFKEIAGAISSVFGDAGSGITGLQFFKNVLSLVEIAVIGFRVGIEEMVNGAKTDLDILVTALTTFADVAIKAFHMDFTGAKADWNAGTAQLEGILKDSTKRMVDIATQGAKDINTALGVGDAPAPEVGFGKGKFGLLDQPAPKPAGGDGGNKGMETKLQAWREELQQEEEAQNAYFKDNTASEIAFWQQKLELVKAGSKDYASIESTLYGLHKQQAKQSLAEDLQDIHSQIADAKAGSTERINLAEQAAQRIGEAYGMESREYKAAIDQVRKEEQAHAKEEEKLATQAIDLATSTAQKRIKIEQARLQENFAMGRVSNEQMLELQQDLENQLYQVELGGLQKKLNLNADDLAAQKKLHDQILELNDQHDLDMQKSTDKLAQEQMKSWNTMLTSMTSAFDTSIKGMIAGTTTFQKAMANMGQSIAATFVDIEVKELAGWIQKEMAKTAATVAGNTQRTVANTVGAQEGGVISATAGKKDVLNEAYQAAAGAFAATAKIPYVGPFLAPEAGAAAFAAVAVMGSSISAAGGFDIPAGVNPIVQTHQREMILPQEHADTIRQLGASGGGGGGQVHFHNHTMDAKGVEDFFKRQGPSIAKGLQHIQRNGLIKGTS